MMLIASRSCVEGRFSVRSWLRGLGWVATAVMALAAATMLVTSF